MLYMPTRKVIPEFAALASAVRANDTGKLESALALGIDVNGTDVLGRTLLMVSAEVGNASIASLLLSHGAKLNTRDRLNVHDSGGKTALYRAVEQRHLEVVRVLLAAGADTEVRDKLGQTALFASVENGDLAITELLLDAGAIPSGSGRIPTPLSIASVLGYTEIAKLLLSSGADPNHPADSRSPVLAKAIFSKATDLCRMLIEAGAHVNAKDEDGKTALDCVGLTTMPDRLPRVTLTPDQMSELRQNIAAAAIIRTMLLNAGAVEGTYVA